eukprot:TRINITY_DN58_c0_g1_i1.p1 TRINITY_DN58_c0_g1~~TRINITY_DN58_c0_g1_i1.p1  ORF type:complete len:427 (+),score=67.54 TRINITY_DN58_c0_g1_i1:773-2053(+)
MNYICGNQLPTGVQPYAHAYAGHRSGVYAPSLGDSRVMSLGFVKGKDGVPQEIQLKGAGSTPFSRSVYNALEDKTRPDGRCALSEAILEYLNSEALSHLGIPCPRVIGVVHTVIEDAQGKKEDLGVVTRYAPSWLRVGSLELPFYSKDSALVQTLCDFVIKHYYPEVPESVPQQPAWYKYKLLLAAIIKRTARLVAQSQAVGYVHGLADTDHVSLIGLLLGVGRGRFMEDIKPDETFDPLDTNNRYKFSTQAVTAYWNMQKLAVAMSKLMPHQVLKATLSKFPISYNQTYAALMLQKLGLREMHAGHKELLSSLLQMMCKYKVKYTPFIRSLSKFTGTLESLDNPDASAKLAGVEEWQRWANNYDRRIKNEASLWTGNDRTRSMDAVNPVYTLTEADVSAAIRAATQNDYQPVANLYTKIVSPYSE